MIEFKMNQTIPARAIRPAHSGGAIMEATTPWTVLILSSESARYLRPGYAVWSRLFDGDHIFTVRKNGTEPGNSDGGFLHLHSALQAVR